MPEHATHRNVTFRLLPGSVETARLLLGTARAARYTWNEIKEARELGFEHAAGRAIERPTFFTLGKAFKALWDRETWLHESHLVHSRVPCRVLCPHLAPVP